MDIGMEYIVPGISVIAIVLSGIALWTSIIDRKEDKFIKVATLLSESIILAIDQRLTLKKTIHDIAALCADAGDDKEKAAELLDLKGDMELELQMVNDHIQRLEEIEVINPKLADMLPWAISMKTFNTKQAKIQAHYRDRIEYLGRVSQSSNPTE